PRQPRGPGSAVQGEYRPLQAAARVPLRGQPAEEPLRQGAEDRAARAACVGIAAVAQTVVRVAHLVDLAHDSVRRGLHVHRIGTGLETLRMRYSRISRCIRWKFVSVYGGPKSSRTSSSRVLPGTILARFSSVSRCSIATRRASEPKRAT